VIAEPGGQEEAFADRMTRRDASFGMVGSVSERLGWPRGADDDGGAISMIHGTPSGLPQYYPHYARPRTYNNIKQQNRNRLLRITPGTTA